MYKYTPSTNNGNMQHKNMHHNKMIFPFFNN